MPGETSAVCFSTLSSIPVPKETTTSPAASSSLSALTKFSSSNRRQLPHRSVRFFVKASGSGRFLGDDAFGQYPWESSSDSGDSSIQWVHEERVTLFTSDGLIQIGGGMVPRRITSSEKKFGKIKTSQRFQRFQESDYMDPNQGLCLGALFNIAATNGLDMGRRLCIFGFCRSIEMLSDVVEDTVLEHGGENVVFASSGKGGGNCMVRVNLHQTWGSLSRFHASVRYALMSVKRDGITYTSELSAQLRHTFSILEISPDVVAAERASKDSLQEKLTMTVAVPLLWGVPPASETLHLAVRSGGGIVEKVYWQWDFV